MKLTSVLLAMCVLAGSLFVGCCFPAEEWQVQITKKYAQRFDCPIEATGEAYLEQTEATGALPVAKAEDILLPVESILQFPELPNGCEATSLAITLAYWGVTADKVELALDYIPRQEITYLDYYTAYGPDPMEYYAGNPTDTSGYYCFAPPLMTGANLFLEEIGSNLAARDVSGKGEEDFIRYLSQEIPVIVWTTLEYGAVEYSENSWILDGTEEVYTPFLNLHCVVLAGVDETHFYVADPYYEEMQQIERDTFMFAYKELGQHALVLEQNISFHSL